MWSRKQTRKSEQNWLCTRYSSNSWQTVNLSSLPLLIECFTSTNVDQHTNTREFSTKKNKKKTIATVLSLLPHTYKSQEAWENVNEKTTNVWKLSDYFWLGKEKKSHIWTKLHGNVSVWATFVTTEMISCYGVRERKRDEELGHKRGTPVNSRADVLSCQGTQSSVESSTIEIQDNPCSIFHI